ncbi:CELSR3 [Mytilus edulis]|uniref:CELSR3 n=1 Tax=Mytilus edulis TaxID=6550 RepID=A0A8S3SNG3_MYTED|nr:CELSR3 [Mytilus edulis]
MLKVDVTLKVLKKVFHHERRLLENSFNGRNTNIIIRSGSKEYIVQIENRKDIVSMGNQSVEFYSLYYHKYRSLVNLDYFLLLLKYKDLYTDFNFDKLCIDQQVTIDVMPNGSFNIDADNVRCPNTDDIGNDQSSSNWSVSAIMTFICFSVSVISLVVLIFFNRKHELNSSIPGSNLENLSISLLVSNLFFIFGIGASSIPILCYVVGVTLHFLWLTVFAFMSIAVLYIMSDLLAMRNCSEEPKRDIVRKRRHITVIGILIPLLIVVQGVVIDQTGPENWSLGYGGAVCFPNRYPSNVVLFSGPVVLSVGIDFVCLTYIISYICRARLELKHVRKLNLYKDAQIYLRLVTLSGGFWTTGIISAIYEMQWLDFLFTILCGLQGFFVAVANINTSRVQSRKSKPIQRKTTDTKT